MKPTQEQLDAWLGTNYYSGDAEVCTLAYQAGAADALAKLRGDVELPEAKHFNEGSCCGNFDVGCEYMGQQELVCCGHPDEHYPLFTDTELLDYGDRRAAAAVPQWMPIESAPKDVFVLVACPSGYSTTPLVFTTAIMHSDYKVGRWIDHANDDLTDWGMQPTHWMPLPQPPKEAL